MRRRHQIYNKIDSLFKRDWRSRDQILTDLAAEYGPNGLTNLTFEPNPENTVDEVSPDDL